MAFLYILECADGTFYTGSTAREPEQREWEHNHDDALGANYTRERRPVRLVYAEQFDRIDDAYSREGQLHGWGHAKKAALIEGRIDNLRALARGRSSSTSSES